MSIGDLVAHLAVDTSDFIGPINAAADAAEAYGARVTHVIREQLVSWLGFTSEVTPAIDNVADVVTNAAATSESGFTDMATAAQQAVPAAGQLAAGLVQVTVAADAIENSGERVVRIIQEQKGSWLNFATAVMPAISGVIEFTATAASTAETGFSAIATATAQAVPATVQLAAGLLNVTAAAVNVGSAIGTTGLAIGGMVTAGAVALATQPSLWNAAAAAAMRGAGIINTVARTLIPQYRAVGLAVGVTLAAWNVAHSEMAANMGRLVTQNGQVQSSYARLTSSIGGLGSALARPFGDAAETSGTFVQMLVERFSPIPAIARGIGSAITAGMDLATSAIQATTSAVTYVQDSFTALALSAANGDWSGQATAAYYAESVALREMAEETARVTALQESRKSQFKMLRDVQIDAAERAGKAEELAAIQHLQTAEAIDTETQRYQLLFRQQINALALGEQLTTGQKAHMKAVMDNLAAQREGVASGRIHEQDEKTPKHEQDEKTPKEEKTTMSAAAQAYKRAQEDLNKLNLGQAEAARVAIMASDATDEEVAKLLELHDQIESLTQAKKKQDEADKLQKQGVERIMALQDQVDLLGKSATATQIKMREMARAGFSQSQIDQVGELQTKLEAIKMNEQATSEIDKLTNEIDVLSGAATKAQVKMREMVGKGYTDEQIKKIGELTGQLDVLQKAEKPEKKHEKNVKDERKASLIGSSETASIFLRGIGGEKNETKKEIEKSNGFLKIIADAANKNTTQPAIQLLAANF